MTTPKSLSLASVLLLAVGPGTVPAAHAMLTNESSKEINLKLIYVGPESSGKAQNLRYVYEHTEAQAKGKMVSLANETENTMFFDLKPKGLGEIRGYGVRLHLYTLDGKERFEASTKLLLKGADGIVFVADCQKHRLEANIEALARVKAAIQEQRRDWSKLPKVFQLNNAHLPGAVTAEELKRALGLAASEVTVVADAQSGAGVFDTLKAGTKELLLGLKDGRLSEWKPSTEERASGDRMTSRVQVVSHFAEFFGEGTHEFGPWEASPKSPPFYVMLHPPTKERPYFTYATFGLSTQPQAPGGSAPRIELIAYSAAENERVAQSLAVVAMMIASGASTDVPFQTFDTVESEDSTQPDSQFALVPPDEVSDFSRFPDEKRNVRDLLFTKAVGAANDADARVTFLKLLPLTGDEMKFAGEKGTPALLKKFAGRPKHFGWGRTAKDSVLLAPRKK